MALKWGADGLVGSDRPEANCVVLATRGERRAVWTEDHAGYCADVAFEWGVELLAGCHIPEADSLVHAPRGQRCAGGAECHTQHVTSMATNQALDPHIR